MMKNRFIQYVLFFITMLFSVPTLAQTVGYTHKPLAAEGCSMNYSITKQEGKFYIIVTVKSDRLLFLQQSTFWLKTFEDDVIKLKGSSIGNGSESLGIVSGNIVIPVTEISSTAQFEISEEQLALLNKGISKVRLSTTPIEHEKNFKKDKIGKKLHQFYLRKKNQDESF